MVKDSDTKQNDSAATLVHQAAADTSLRGAKASAHASALARMETCRESLTRPLFPDAQTRAGYSYCVTQGFHLGAWGPKQICSAIDQGSGIFESAYLERRGFTCSDIAVYGAPPHRLNSQSSFKALETDAFEKCRILDLELCRSTFEPSSMCSLSLYLCWIGPL